MGGAGPGRRCQMTVEPDRKDGYSSGFGPAALPGFVLFGHFALNRANRVLKRAVVQFHHVLVFGARPVQTAGQVHHDYVEAARSQPEIQSLGVDHHLVADLARSNQGEVGPGWTVLLTDPDLKGPGGGDRSASKLQHRAASSRIDSHTSSIAPRFA